MARVLLVVLALALFTVAKAGITPFNLDLPPNTYISERIGVFARDKVPFPQYALFDPYGQWSFTFSIKKGEFDLASTHMMVGTSEQIKRVGIWFEHTRFLCCTPYLVNQSMCNMSDVNQIAFPKDMDPHQDNGTFFYFPIEFGMVSDTEAQGGIGPYRVNLTTQSIWYMLIVNCNDNENKTSTTVRVRGTSVWVNPFGYLPGQLYGQLPVYWTLTILYFIFLLGWTISCLCYKSSLHPVQYAMLVVLLVSFMENMIWGSAFVRYNQVGTNDNIWNGFGTFFLALKLTLSRTMLLLICMGYSITNAEIPRQQQYAVLGLSLCYFIIVAANHFITVLQDHGDQISYSSKMLLVFLDAIVSGSLFIWMFASLHYTRDYLLKTQEFVKRRMYTALAISIGIAVGVSFIIFCFEFSVQLLSYEDKVWMGEFFFTLYWEFAFFTILIAVAIIWRPHRENYRYAHVEDELAPTNEQEMDTMAPNPLNLDSK
jgi:hypothetical protein